MDLKAFFKQQLKQFRAEMKQKYVEQKAKEAELEFELEFDTLDDVAAAEVLPVEPPKMPKKKRTKLLHGFTKAEVFIPIVVDALRDGPKSKKQIATMILKANILCDKDYEMQHKGVPRYYKTLDRTRRFLIKQSAIKTDGGVWSLT